MTRLRLLLLTVAGEEFAVGTITNDEAVVTGLKLVPGTRVVVRWEGGCCRAVTTGESTLKLGAEIFPQVEPESVVH